MYALKNMGYKKIAVFFAFVTLLASLGGGNSAQSGAMAEAFLSIGIL
jgi:Na+/alanine symporter